MYLVTVYRDAYEEIPDVEIAGVFDTLEKACDAKEKVETWLEDEGYEDFDVFVTEYKVNQLSWEDLEEDL